MDDPLSTFLVLIPALPLAAAICVALLGPRVLREHSHWPVVLALIGSFICSLGLAREVLQRQKQAGDNGFEHVTTLWTWGVVEDAFTYSPLSPGGREAGGEGATSGEGSATASPRDFRIDVTLRADALT